MKTKRVLCVVLVFVIISGLISSVAVNAISIDDQQVILKQPARGDGTCYFTSCLNMFRRRAIIDGISDWQGITHDNYRYVITSNGTWVKATITNVKGMNAGWVGLSSIFDKKSTLLNYLSTHPEGIVIHSEQGVEHAVLLTGYDSSTDTFYCIDTLYSRPNEGVVKLSSSWMGSDGATQEQIVGRLDSLMYITNKSGGSSSDPAPGKPELIDIYQYYRAGKPITFNWSPTQNTTHYNIYIDKLNNGTYERLENIHYATSGLTRTLEQGEYRIQLQSTNSNYNWIYTNGDWKHFIVLDQLDKPVLNDISPYYRNDSAIRFTWSPTENTTHYNVYIQKMDNGVYSMYEPIHYAESGLTRELSKGSYRVQLQSTNSYCYADDGVNWLYNDSEWEYFDVLEELEAPTLNVLKSCYKENEEITFLWSPTKNTTHYNVYIQKLNDNNYIMHEPIHYAESGLIRTLSEGSYRVQLQSTNSYCYADDGVNWLYSDSEWIYFVVEPNNSAENEQYLEVQKDSGRWNDLPSKNQDKDFIYEIEPEEKTGDNIRLSDTNLDLTVGDKEYMILYGVKASLTPYSGDIIWESSNDDVVSVISDRNEAVVSAVGSGKATITVSSKEYGIKASCKVTVEKKMHTVTFKANGGFNSAKKAEVEDGKKLKEPDEPTKDGYVFDGWFVDENYMVKYDFNNKVTKDITLYAGWHLEDVTEKQIILKIGKKSAKVFGKSKDNDVAPKIVNQRTMLPARFVAENLGATVNWNAAMPDVVTINSGSTFIYITVGANIALINGKEIALDSAAFVENGRTYVPIRFLSEALGAKVEWNSNTQEVIITP